MAWWVLFGHAAQASNAFPFLFYRVGKFLIHGDIAVQVFMVVSGFVITHLLTLRQEPYGTYIARRYGRLAPLLIVMMVVAVLTREIYRVAYTNQWIDEPGFRLARMASEDADWPSHLALHLTLLHGMVPDSLLSYSSTTFVGAAWSIGLEWQFYLLAPLLVVAMVERRHLWLIAGLLVASACAHLGYLGHWNYQSFLPIALPFFLIGISSRLALDGRLGWFAIAVTAASVAIYLSLVWVDYWLLIVPLAWGTTLGASLLENREVKSPVVRWIMQVVFLNRVSRALGRVSYSTYLCHVPIFGIVMGLGIMAFGDGRATVLGLTALAVLLCIPASFALYRWVEMPGQRFASQLIKRRREPAVA